MVVPSIADRYLPDCTTESSRQRPVKGDSFVADKPREWSDTQLGDRIRSLTNFDLVATDNASLTGHMPRETRRKGLSRSAGTKRTALSLASRPLTTHQLGY